MTEEESGEIARVFERQASIEKQQVYEDAFMEQMEKYLQCGEFDSKKILTHVKLLCHMKSALAKRTCAELKASQFTPVLLL